MKKKKEYPAFCRPEKRSWLKINSYGNVNWENYEPNKLKWYKTDISIIVLRNCKIPFYKILTGFSKGGGYFNPNFITVVPIGYKSAIETLSILRENGKQQRIIIRPFIPTRKVLIEKTIKP